MFLNKFFKTKQKLIKQNEYTHFLNSLTELELFGVYKLFYFLSLDSDLNSLIKDIVRDSYLNAEVNKNKKNKELILSLKNILEEDSFSKSESEVCFKNYYKNNIDERDLNDISIFDLSFFTKIELADDFELNSFIEEIKDCVYFKCSLEPVEAVAILSFISEYFEIEDEQHQIQILIDSLRKSFIPNLIKFAVSLESFGSEFKIKKHLKMFEEIL